MNILVIGATGYVGGAIAAALKKRGHEVTAVARSAHAREELERLQFAVVDGDASRPHSLFAPARAADAIVYAVSVTDADAFAVDSQALRQLVEASRHPRKRLLYTSGVWIYGDTGSEPASETSPLNPPPLVARRPELEAIVLDASQDGGVHGIVVRPGLVFGRGGGIPTMFVTSAHERGAATILGNGTNHWAVVHADDLGMLFALALEGGAPGAIYNATDGTSFTVREIAEAASRGALKDGNVSQVPAASMGHYGEALTLDQRVSSKRAQDELGWRPAGPTILDDLERGSYALAAAPAAAP